MIEVPREDCRLVPSMTCKMVTTSVPRIKRTTKCLKVPKEVCGTSRVNPRKVRKPVVKTWCEEVDVDEEEIEDEQQQRPDIIQLPAIELPIQQDGGEGVQ